VFQLIKKIGSFATVNEDFLTFITGVGAIPPWLPSCVRMPEFPPDEVREFLTKLSLVGTKNYSSDLK
jgi:hypothetical protein